MPIIDHKAVPETPWRPDYRKWDLAGAKDGITSNLSYSVVGGGAGAPLHAHLDDELIVVLEGTLEVRLGEELYRVGADHTVVVPPNVPHGFTSVGEQPARLMVFPPSPTLSSAPPTSRALSPRARVDPASGPGGPPCFGHTPGGRYGAPVFVYNYSWLP